MNPKDVYRNLLLLLHSHNQLYDPNYKFKFFTKCFNITNRHRKLRIKNQKNKIFIYDYCGQVSNHNGWKFDITWKLFWRKYLKCLILHDIEPKIFIPILPSNKRVMICEVNTITQTSDKFIGWNNNSKISARKQRMISNAFHFLNNNFFLSNLWTKKKVLV